MTRLNHLENKSPFFWTIASLCLVIIIFVVDVTSGYELSFSLFYLLPVAMSAWLAGKKIGITMSVVCAVCWITADNLSGHTYTHPAMPYWNTIIRFSVFLIVALLISALRKAHENEKIIARIDNLTGAVNYRFFNELLQMEIDRTIRKKSPFTVVYMDIDNFKYVNDHLGHSTGDQALRVIVNHTKSALRKIDIVARLGGDEFAFLLSETGQEDARIAVSKIQAGLLAEMREHNWPLTFSIGVITCDTIPDSIDNLINQADELMYAVKHSSKNAVRYADYIPKNRHQANNTAA